MPEYTCWLADERDALARTLHARGPREAAAEFIQGLSWSADTDFRAGIVVCVRDCNGAVGRYRVRGQMEWRAVFERMEEASK